ncbi:hypothetical protein [Actinomadura sp. NPDC049753]
MAAVRYAGVAFQPVDLPDPAPVELSLAWRRGDNPALALLLRHL